MSGIKSTTGYASGKKELIARGRVWEYIYSCHEALHTTGTNYIIEDIDLYKGIDTVFQLNPGNHYDHAAERTAAGIAWLLSR